MRFNTTNNSVEFYDNGVWKEIRLKEPTPITQQSLGTGDGVETVFGPLDANDILSVYSNSTECVSTCRKRVTNFNY